MLAAASKHTHDLGVDLIWNFTYDGDEFFADIFV